MSTINLTKEELINLATPVREMTEEETNKFVARLKYNEQFYEQYHKIGTDTFDIRSVSGNQAPIYTKWWYNLLPLVEFTLKDLHMEDLLVKITGMHNYGYDNIDAIIVTLHNGKIYVVYSCHFNYPRETAWIYPCRCGWTFGGDTSVCVGEFSYLGNGNVISAYEDGTFLMRSVFEC